MTDTSGKHRALYGVTILVTATLVGGLVGGLFGGLGGVSGSNGVSLDCVDDSGGAAYVADSGLTVYENDPDVTYGNFGSESVTFQGGAVEFSAPGDAEVRMDDGTGGICLANVRASESAPVAVDPAGEFAPVVVSSDVAEFTYRDPVYATDNGGADAAYDAPGTVGLTVRSTGFADGQGIVARDAETGGRLATGTVDASGAVALDLPAGTERVDLRRALPPTASDDSYAVDEDGSLSASGSDGLLANDDDPDSDRSALSVTTTPVSGPDDGSLTLNADGSFTYAPDANFDGTDTFEYEVTDDTGGADTATVTVDVRPVNDAPAASDGSATTDEDTSVTVDVVANDADVDGDSLDVTAITDGPSHGTAEIVGGSDDRIEFDPGTDETDDVAITYEVSDGNGGTDTATLSVTVDPVNDAPSAVADSATTDEDTSVTVDVVANDADVDGDSLDVTAITDGPSHGTATIVSGSDDRIEFDPGTDETSDVAITYEVSDGNGGTDTATLSVTVDPVPDAPAASDDSYATDEDVTVTGDVLENDADPDGDALTASVAAGPTDGDLDLDADGTFEYVPDGDFNGEDSFTYRVADGTGRTDTATVTFSVAPVNDPPVAGDDRYAVSPSGTISVGAGEGVLADDSDVDGDDLSVSTTPVSGPEEGSLTLDADGSFTYVPGSGFDGTDSFTYRVTDGAGGSDTATVVVADGTAPTAVAGPDRRADVGEPLGFDGASSTDNTGIASFEWDFGDGASASGTRPVHTYDSPGTYTVALTVADAAGNTDTDTLTVTVEESDEDDEDEDADTTSPTAVAGSDRTVDVSDTVAFDGSTSTDDVGVASYEWAFGDGATATGPTPTHAYDSPGTYTVTLTVTDAAGNADSDTLAVTVEEPTDENESDRSFEVEVGGDDAENETVSTNESVEFDASGVDDAAGVEWDFGDGTTATGPSTTHTFGEPGEYPVTVTVTYGDGTTETDTITVTAGLPASFAVGSVTLTNATTTRVGNVTVRRGEQLNVSVTLANVGERTGTRTVTLGTNGTVLANATVGLDGGANRTVRFVGVNTTVLSAGNHTLVVNATDARATARLRVVPETRGRHESGVPLPVFRAVAGPDGVLDRSDVLGMVVDYANERPTDGVALTREQVLELVRYYANEG